MDEFLVAIMTGTAFILYQCLQSLFEWNVNTKWVLLGVIVVYLVLYWIRRRLEKRAIARLGVDEESYLYYRKYTSLGNKISYIITYLLQDFIYEVKKTNKSYNFSKGMFRFDDSLGEYYVDCRMAWYAYFRSNLLKNRLSLHKLRIFSLGKANQILLDAFPEQREAYLSVKKTWEEENDQLPDKKKVNRDTLLHVEGARGLHHRILVNLVEMEFSRKFIKDYMDDYQIILKKSEKRKDDVREIKNFQVNIAKKEK